VLVTRGGGWMEVSNLAIRCAEETVYNLQVSESRNYLVGIIQALVHNRKKEGHILDWELRGPRGGKLECGEEFSGAERTFPKGTKLTFPQQSWYSHTEGKVIADLYYEGKLRPGRQLRLEGTLPPCAACQSICKWASEQFKMEIMYYDGVQGLFWVWKDGELRRR
jgi:hypothetical protein